MDLNSLMENIDFIRIGIKALIMLIIFIGTMLLARLTRKFVQIRIDKATVDVTQLNFVKHILTGAIYFIGFILIIFQIDYLKSISISMLASSGIVAVIIGFASQQTFANLVSGLFISFFKPFRIGDRISFIEKNTMGIVEDITLRHTIIRTFENKRVIIPNNVMNNEMIENASIIEEKTCNYLNVGISYDSDLNQAMKIIKEEILTHKDYFDNRTQEEIVAGNEPVDVKLINFGESSIDLRAWVWSKDPATGFAMVCDLRKVIKERFDREGIEIPYPYRTVIVKNEFMGGQ